MVATYTPTVATIPGPANFCVQHAIPRPAGAIPQGAKGGEGMVRAKGTFGPVRGEHTGAGGASPGATRPAGADQTNGSPRRCQSRARVASQATVSARASSTGQR